MNKNFNSREKFQLIMQNSHYLRVDDTHQMELLIGINDNGEKTIRFVGNFVKTKIRGTKSIEINHYAYKDKLILSFSLVDDEYVDLFYLFCNDLVDSSREIQQEMGYTYLVNRFERWRSFSGLTRKYLSEPEIKGLIGELLFLNDVLFEKYGVSKSIQGWTGSEPLKKDFSYDETWFEVKAVTGDKVSISSIDQLDSNVTGFLVLYSLEKLSPEASGASLNRLCDQIFDRLELDMDRQTFLMKLIQANFYREEYYDQFVYANTRTNFYEVNDSFPKLTRELMPEAIANAKYDLIINMLERFKRDSI